MRPSRRYPKPTNTSGPGLTFDALDAIAYAVSDSDAARYLNQARATVFRSINMALNPAA